MSQLQQLCGSWQCQNRGRFHEVGILVGGGSPIATTIVRTPVLRSQASSQMAGITLKTRRENAQILKIQNGILKVLRIDEYKQYIFRK